METKNLWVRVIVGAYRGIPVIVDAIEKFIDRAAIGGNGDCIALFDNLTEKSDRKSRLINLKCLADDAIAALKGNAKFIIENRIQGVSFDAIAKSLNMSIRAIFRNYENALCSMTAHLKVRGFDDEWFGDYLGGEPYILNAVKRTKNF
ncbi:MAG: hypothetical protein LBT30_04095 [Clostridiales bacterium]|jgi:hypothetical protein|nr:hypothetical protein [Clostridiales bacterium]